MGKHRYETNEEDDGTHVSIAGEGYTYDAVKDAFMIIWAVSLNEETMCWDAGLGRTLML